MQKYPTLSDIEQREADMMQAEWLTAHDYISEAALESKVERDEFEQQLQSNFRKVFTEDLGVFLPAEYRL